MIEKSLRIILLPTHMRRIGKASGKKNKKKTIDSIRSILPNLHNAYLRYIVGAAKHHCRNRKKKTAVTIRRLNHWHIRKKKKERKKEGKKDKTRKQRHQSIKYNGLGTLTCCSAAGDVLATYAYLTAGFFPSVTL